MDSITRFQIKETEEEYLVKDSKAVRNIECIYTNGETEELSPDSDGKLTLKIPTIIKATNKNLGGVLISLDKDNTNISLDKNGYIYAIVPIKEIYDPDGFKINSKEDDETSIMLPRAKLNSYGLVKQGNNVFLDSYGQLSLKFGDSDDVFNNIKEEKEYIKFNLEDFAEEDDGAEV